MAGFSANLFERFFLADIEVVFFSLAISLQTFPSPPFYIHYGVSAVDLSFGLLFMRLPQTKDSVQLKRHHRDGEAMMMIF